MYKTHRFLIQKQLTNSLFFLGRVRQNWQKLAMNDSSVMRGEREKKAGDERLKSV